MTLLVIQRNQTAWRRDNHKAYKILVFTAQIFEEAQVTLRAERTIDNDACLVDFRSSLLFPDTETKPLEQNSGPTKSLLGMVTREELLSREAMARERNGSTVTRRIKRKQLKMPSPLS